jgi:hypothetical protein
MAFTKFMDMHSGGGRKLEWEYIWIEGDEATARDLFEARFGRDPDNVTCSCCGQDYSVSEYDTLKAATSYERQGGLSPKKAVTVKAYFTDNPDVLLIRAA